MRSTPFAKNTRFFAPLTTSSDMHHDLGCENYDLQFERWLHTCVASVGLADTTKCVE